MQNYRPWLLSVLGTPDWLNVDILIMDINAAAEQSVVCHIPALTTRHVLTVNIFVCFPDICTWNHIIWPEVYHGNEQSRIILLKSFLNIILTYHCTNGIGILLQTSASCINITYLNNTSFCLGWLLTTNWQVHATWKLIRIFDKINVPGTLYTTLAFR